jgi:hypothetical protein
MRKAGCSDRTPLPGHSPHPDRPGGYSLPLREMLSEKYCCRISSTRGTYSNKGPGHTEYEVTVTSMLDGTTTTVWHRYSEFRKLYKSLRKITPKPVDMKWDFPGKVVDSLKEDVIEKRQRALSRFLLKTFFLIDQSEHYQEFVGLKPSNVREEKKNSDSDLNEEDVGSEEAPPSPVL